MSNKAANQIKDLESIVQTRKSEKLLKDLGQDMLNELDTLTADELKQTVVTAYEAMKTAKDELEANNKYKQAKADVSHCSAGKKAVDKFQKAKIEYACARLDDFGKLVMHDQIALKYALDTAKAARAKAKREQYETEAKSGPVYQICLACNRRKPCICEKSLGKDEAPKDLS